MKFCENSRVPSPWLIKTTGIDDITCDKKKNQPELKTIALYAKCSLEAAEYRDEKMTTQQADMRLQRWMGVKTTIEDRWNIRHIPRAFFPKTATLDQTNTARVFVNNIDKPNYDQLRFAYETVNCWRKFIGEHMKDRIKRKMLEKAASLGMSEGNSHFKFKDITNAFSHSPTVKNGENLFKDLYRQWDLHPPYAYEEEVSTCIRECNFRYVTEPYTKGNGCFTDMFEYELNGLRKTANRTCQRGKKILLYREQTT